MQLGGLKHDKERVFLTSGTHGAEAHGLAAALETITIMKESRFIDILWHRGE